MGRTRVRLASNPERECGSLGPPENARLRRSALREEVGDTDSEGLGDPAERGDPGAFPAALDLTRKLSLSPARSANSRSVRRLPVHGSLASAHRLAPVATGNDLRRARPRSCRMSEPEADPRPVAEGRGGAGRSGGNRRKGEQDERSVQGHDQCRHPRLGAGLGAVRAAQGARRRTQRDLHRARRRRLLGDELLRRADRDAEHRPDRRRRRALHAVAHDGALLADALVPADRAQPHAQQHGLHHRGGDRLPERKRDASRPRTACSRRSSASVAGTRTWSASGTSAPRTR